jgi:hypothetical protein
MKLPYMIIPEHPIPGAIVDMFDTVAKAMAEAKSLSMMHKTNIMVVKILGWYELHTEWSET